MCSSAPAHCPARAGTARLGDVSSHCMEHQHGLRDLCLSFKIQTINNRKLLIIPVAPTSHKFSQCLMRSYERALSSLTLLQSTGTETSQPKPSMLRQLKFPFLIGSWIAGLSIFMSSVLQVLIITSSAWLMINLFEPYELQTQTNLEMKIHALVQAQAP